MVCLFCTFNHFVLIYTTTLKSIHLLFKFSQEENSLTDQNWGKFYLNTNSEINKMLNLNSMLYLLRNESQLSKPKLNQQLNLRLDYILT